jgi:transcriptional regulator with XRE-family HTH domain
MNTIGENIKKLREQKGLSQKELAGMIEVNPAQYGRVENDKVEPTLKTLLKIADALEVTLDDLVKGKDDPLKEVEVKDKSLMSKIQMIDQLPTDEKETVLKVIDMALTKMKMKDFFQQQLAQ